MITANGLPVIEMRLTFPLSGLWVASLEVGTEEAITGSCTLAQEGTALSFVGYVVRSGAIGGSCRAKVVGGAGGLVTDVPARSYRGARARSVAGELLAAVGETLATSSTRAVLATELPFWTRAAGRASDAVWRLTDALGARWRVLPSGAVWIGTDAWTAKPSDDPMELDRDGLHDTVSLAPDTLSLLPGMTLRGEHVGRIEYLFGRDTPLRATAWVEP